VTDRKRSIFITDKLAWSDDIQHFFACFATTFGALTSTDLQYRRWLDLHVATIPANHV
jgi:hypothetical protein